MECALLTPTVCRSEPNTCDRSLVMLPIVSPTSRGRQLLTVCTVVPTATQTNTPEAVCVTQPASASIVAVLRMLPNAPAFRVPCDTFDRAADWRAALAAHLQHDRIVRAARPQGVSWTAAKDVRVQVLIDVTRLRLQPQRHDLGKVLSAPARRPTPPRELHAVIFGEVDPKDFAGFVQPRLHHGLVRIVDAVLVKIRPVARRPRHVDAQRPADVQVDARACDGEEPHLRFVGEALVARVAAVNHLHPRVVRVRRRPVSDRPMHPDRIPCQKVFPGVDVERRRRVH
mmetsp:Transcript_22891/g.61416  ORF Transcript_22891/g.61416 Transcript_22891/m.61416 type:complete len:285 (+) Transcript_22891:156-1010(+)